MIVRGTIRVEEDGAKPLLVVLYASALSRAGGCISRTRPQGQEHPCSE